MLPRSSARRETCTFIVWLWFLIRDANTEVLVRYSRKAHHRQIKIRSNYSHIRQCFWCDICVVYFSVCIPTYNACKNQNICGGKVPQKSIFRSLYRHPYFWSLSLAQALLSTIEWVIKQSFLRRFQRAGVRLHLKVGGARSRRGRDMCAPESLETAEGSSDRSCIRIPIVWN